MNKRYSCQSGQTLLELVIAIGVVAIVVMALVSAVTGSLRYSKFAQDRSRGLKYAQEGMELARKLRDANTWDVFQDYSSGIGSWCLDGAGAWTIDDGTGTCPISEGSTYWRNVHFSWTDPIMEVTIRVSWGERTDASAIEMKTRYTQWK